MYGDPQVLHVLKLSFPSRRSSEFGSEAELTCSEAGVLWPLVGLVGSLQALEALRLLAGFGDPLFGRLLLIDALGSRFRELRVKRDPGCSVCGGSQQDRKSVV